MSGSIALRREKCANYEKCLNMLQVPSYLPGPYVCKKCNKKYLKDA